MKKYIFLFAALVMAMAMSADGLTGKRIYINPGHGSFGANDRPMATIPYPNLKTTGMPDTCGFYESNTNLWKCERIGEELSKQGALVNFSRTKNGPWPYEKVDGDYPAYTSEAYKALPDYEKYNRNLTEIAEEVEAGNYDYFVSVHSNALTDGTTTNYPLYLYRGTDDESDCNGDSKKRCQTCWPYFFECMNSGIDPYSNYGLTNQNVRGDLNFYGSGSTRTSIVSGKTYKGYLGVLKHGCPGFLVEGYFHTYQPARHRALNRDYCRQEGLRHYRGIAAYYGVADTKGCIMGTVKDLHERISDPLFNYTPKTNDQWLPCNGAVVTLYKAGKEVAKYNVDNNYNGIFVFENLEPGNDYTLDATCAGYKPLFDEYKTSVTVTANATAYPMLYLEDSAYVAPTIHYDNYPDPEQPSYAALADRYLMKQAFTDKVASVLEGRTIRRALYRDGNLFVLSLDANNEPLLVSIDVEKGTVVDTLATDFCTSVKGIKLNDIAFTAEGVLLGCNTEAVTFSPSNKWLIYKWEQNAMGWKGSVFATSTTNETSGNYSDAVAGVTLAYSGTLDEGTLYAATYSTWSATHGFRIVMYSFSGGAYAGAARNQNSAYALSTWGHNLQFVISPNATDQYVAMDDSIAPLELKAVNKTSSAPTEVGRFSERVQGANFFRYAGRSLMVTPTKTGVALYDVTYGLDNATLVETTNTELTGDYTTAYAFAVVSGMEITIYLLRDNKISKFTTAGVDQPAVVNIMPSQLKQTLSDGVYTFSFYSNDDAQNASIVFTDDADNESFYPIANVKKGTNTYQIAAAALPGANDKTLQWGVMLEGKTVPAPGKIYGDTKAYTRASVAVDVALESEHFGQIYVMDRKGSSNASNGLYAYTPDYKPINTTPYKGAAVWGSPMRVNVGEDGLVYCADWGDGHPGVYVFDPADNSVRSFFEYDNIASSGIMTKGGVEVAASSPGCFMFGSGEARKLFVFNEDGGSTLVKNGISIYNVGTKTSWGEAPSLAKSLTGQANGNSGVWAVNDKGFFVSQYRGVDQNVASVPALTFYNMNAERVWYSAENEDLMAILNGSMRGAFALSFDGQTMVVQDASSNFVFFSVDWSGEKPEFNYQYTYNHGLGQAEQLAFDYAGNLYAVIGTWDSSMKLYVFTCPNSHNVCYVKALDKYNVTKVGGVTVTGVSFTQEAVEVEQKKTIDVSGLVQLAPENATNKFVTWSSDNESIASVDNNGIITGVSVGKTSITAITIDGDFSATLNVTVKPISVTGVRILSGTNGRMEVGSGSNYALSFEVLPSDAANKNTTWTTSNPDLITIQAQAGLIMPVSAGEAWVYVTTVDGGFRDSLYVVIDGGNVPAELTYSVTVPAGTPECYIAGDFNGWTFSQMNKVDDTHYTLTIKAAKAAQGYKYVCGADWKYVEVAADGQDIGNRTYSKADVVAAWKEIPAPSPTDLTYSVTVPAGTPECYIAGEFNEWTFSQMNKVDDTHYTLTIKGSTSAQGYKYACGADWKYVEVAADGQDIANRTYSEADVVAAWLAVPGSPVLTDLTYSVTVPAGTPECYIAGEFNEWTFSQMNKVDDTHYTLTIKGSTSAQGYKYTCGADWKYVEVAADGQDIDNRTYSEADVVAAWKEVPGSSVLTDLTYNVTVPEGTVECWIAGEFSEWGFLQMTKIDDTHYTLFIAGSKSTDEYKYACHNSWDYVEKDAQGEDIDGNRTYSDADEVASWAKIWTSVDNVTVSNEVVKFVRDGQVLIRKNGKLYNMQGQEITE